MVSKGLNERIRYPLFVIGSLMMILPAYLLYAKAPIAGIDYEISVGIGFLLFVLSISMSLFGEKISYL